jgi:hypothetical protein
MKDMSVTPVPTLQAAGAPPPSTRTGARAFVICGASALATAAVIALVNATAPFAHGWWLVAYLALVGGVAQILLGPGLIALAVRGGADAPVLRRAHAELVLWNAGTVMVAVSDLAAAPGGVLAGSMLLVAALALFAGEWRATAAAAPRRAPAWMRTYAFLLGFLAVSVVVGTVLAYRGRA